LSGQRHRLSIGLGIGFGLVFLWLSVREVDLRSLSEAFAQADLWFALPFLVIFYGYFWIKAARWAAILRPVHPMSIKTTYPATVIGYLGNLVLPAYIGELGRSYLLSRQLSIPYAPVLTSIVLERLLDLLTLMGFLGILLLLEHGLPPEIALVADVLGAATLVLAIVLGWVAYYPGVALRLIENLSRALPVVGPKLAPHLAKVPEALFSLKDPRLLTIVLLLSVAHWAVMGLCIQVSLMALQIDVPLAAGFVVLILIVGGMALPNSPGFFGTIQLCFVLGLKAYGVAAEIAFAASIFYHALMYIFVWVIGLFHLQRAGYNLRTLRETDREIQD
jgi:uncharacterized protein (TIRG00374 family)